MWSEFHAQASIFPTFVGMVQFKVNKSRAASNRTFLARNVSPKNSFLCAPDHQL